MRGDDPIHGQRRTYVSVIPHYFCTDSLRGFHLVEIQTESETTPHLHYSKHSNGCSCVLDKYEPVWQGGLVREGFWHLTTMYLELQYYLLNSFVERNLQQHIEREQQFR